MVDGSWLWSIEANDHPSTIDHQPTSNPNLDARRAMENQGHAQSDRKEFERLFSRSYQRAYNLAYRYTGNESDAEDLTQDAFVRAWGSYHRYDRRRSFEVWLLRILSNLAIDRW